MGSFSLSFFSLFFLLLYTLRLLSICVERVLLLTVSRNCWTEFAKIKFLIFILFSRIDIPIRLYMQRMIVWLIGREIPIIKFVFYTRGPMVPAGRHPFLMCLVGLPQVFTLLR